MEPTSTSVSPLGNKAEKVYDISIIKASNGRNFGANNNLAVMIFFKCVYIL